MEPTGRLQLEPLYLDLEFEYQHDVPYGQGTSGWLMCIHVCFANLHPKSSVQLVEAELGKSKAKHLRLQAPDAPLLLGKHPSPVITW